MDISMFERKKAIVFALVAILTISATLMTCVPFAAAKTETVAYLSFRPNPIGVNQELLVNIWISPPPAVNTSDYLSSLPRTDYMVYLTDPDGNVETVGPMDAYGDGTMWFTYTPDQVGNWTLQFNWAGDDIFEGCATEKQVLVVQQEPIANWPAADLPTDNTWTYPINPENREWAQISGAWLCMGYNASNCFYNPYSQAPSSSHILWMLPPTEGIGGQIGGEYSTTGWYGSNASTIDVVMAGRGYYQAKGIIHCIDIRKGEELWNAQGSYTQGIIAAEPIYWEGNVAGTTNIPALISIDTNFIMYDALTGEIIHNEPCIPGLQLIEYPYVYTFDGQNLIKWSCYGDVADFSERIIWSTEAPWLFVYKTDGKTVTSILLEEWGGSGSIDATTRELLWHSMDCPYMNENPNPAIASGKIYYPTINEHYAAVDLRTGETAWLSEEADYPWGTFWGYGTTVAYNLVYGVGYAGVYAFDESTGEIVWHYSAGNSGFETPYGSWCFFATPIVADGKIYTATGDHHISTPTSRGQELYCLDALTGNKIWSIMGYYTPTAVAEGTVFATNAYDGYSYAFAKGQTVTTISATPEVAMAGSNILIKGTILDQSPAQPNTPAVSDESMSSWMEYLHMQQSMPTDATGVQVHLTATDANGNTFNIGTVTSNLKGNFAAAWTPSSSGVYTITATFEGSNSYYQSEAETTIAIAANTDLPATTEPTTTSATSPSATTTNPTATSTETLLIAAIAAVIVIAVVVAAMILRKRNK